jgi:putative hydrolase of the HAD superfamily
MDIKVNSETVWCFDLDDTLYNELDYLKSAYAEISRVVEPTSPLNLYARMISMYRNKEDVFDYLTQNYTITKEELLSEYRNHLPHIAPFNGVKELFEGINSKKGKLVCITDGRSISQRNKLSALGLLDYFDLLVISEEIGSEKPSPMNYSLVEEHFPSMHYTYVGDNWKKDFLIPNERGWHSIGLIDNGKNIHSGVFQYMMLEAHRPKALIRYISELHILA